MEETAGLTHVFYQDIHIMGHPFICDAVRAASCDLSARGCGADDHTDALSSGEITPFFFTFEAVETLNKGKLSRDLSRNINQFS